MPKTITNKTNSENGILESEICKDPLIKSTITSKVIDDLTTFKNINIDATELDEINLCVMSDWHAGEEAHNGEKLIHVLDKIKKLDNAKIICLGDLCDNSTKNSVGDANSSTMNPHKQEQYVIKLLQQEQIKNKIIAVVGGNHDGLGGTRNIDSNSSPNLLIATALGLYNKATDFDAYIKIKMRAPFLPESKQDVFYVVSARHGSGKNGAPWGGALDKTMGNKKLTSANMYLTGHYHANEFGTDMQMMKIGGKLVEVPVHFYSANSYLENAHYASANGFPAPNNEHCILNIKILPNINYILATKTKQKQLLPFVFAVSQIFVDSPEYDMLITKQEKLKKMTDKQRTNYMKKEFQDNVKKLFTSYLSPLTIEQKLNIFETYNNLEKTEEKLSNKQIRSDSKDKDMIR